MALKGGTTHGTALPSKPRALLDFARRLTEMLLYHNAMSRKCQNKVGLWHSDVLSTSLPVETSSCSIHMSLE